MNKVTIAIINLFFPYHQDTSSSENKAVTGNIKTTVNLTKQGYSCNQPFSTGLVALYEPSILHMLPA